MPLLVITGQLGAGKSTLARAVAAQFEHAVHVDVDAIRELVVSGLASPLVWTGETTRQFSLAVEGAMALAAVYHGAGFAVLVEGAVDPGEVVESARGAGLSTHLVGVTLHPPLEVALRRNRERTHKGIDTTALEPVIRMLDAELTSSRLPDGWHVLDNGTQTLEESAEHLLALLTPWPDASPAPDPRRPASGDRPTPPL